MKHKIRNTLLALAAFAMVGGVGATTALVNAGSLPVNATNYQAVETLDLTTKAAKCTAYYLETEYGNWTIANGANNNGGWAYFKMGGKNTTLAENNPCYIYSTVASTAQYDKITVSGPSGSLSKNGMAVTNWGVYVYSDAALTKQIDYVAGSNSSITNSAWSADFLPSEGKTWAKGSFIKVSWTLENSTSTNGIVCVDNITCFAESTGSIEDVTIDGEATVESGYLGLATTQLTASVTATGGLAETVTWESGNTSVAAVDNNGFVRFLTNGSATIRATSTVDTSVYDEVTVTASNLVAFTGSTDVGDFTDTTKWGTNTISDFSGALKNIEFADGGSTGTKLAYNKAGNMRIYTGTVLSLTCSSAFAIDAVILSSEEGVPFSEALTPSSGSGALFGLDAFVVTDPASACQELNLSYDGVNAYVDTMTVYYHSTGACGITINSPVDALTKGNSGTFTATATGATNPVITWSSSDSNIIEVVSTTGAYNAKFVGKATITATLTCDEGTDSASMDIVVSGPVSIAEANTIAAGLNEGEQTDFKVTLTGAITDLNPGGKDEGSENDITLSDHKVGGTGESILVYGLSNTTKLNGKAFREFGILNGTLSVSGNIKNYKGTLELANLSLLSYTDDAMEFAAEAYEYLDESCAVGVGSVTDEQWSHLSTEWASVDPYAQAKLKAADASYEYDEGIALWMNRYSIIVGAGRADFMDAGIAASWFVGTSSRNSNVAIVVTLFALFGAASVGACVYFKKRKRA